MSESQLDAFLSSGAQPPEGAPERPAEPAPPERAATPEKPPEAPREAKGEAKAPAAEPDDDPAALSTDGRSVPIDAFQRARTDWKGKVIAAETEARLLREQLEAAKKPPPAPPAAPPPFVPIDPAQDPQGYHQRVTGVVLNERLNVSEMLAVDKHGREKIDDEVGYFKKRAEGDGRLWSQLYNTPHPYQWMLDSNATARLHDEIGTDPAAYEARLRQKWEQERGNGNAPPVSPAAGLPPSLANVRSSGGRATNGYAGPPALDDILRREPRRR
jgi:hypothetical protein